MHLHWFSLNEFAFSDFGLTTAEWEELWSPRSRPQASDPGVEGVERRLLQPGNLAAWRGGLHPTFDDDF